MNKNNIFEHVSYEFDIYLYTFNKICEMGSYKKLYGYIENQNLFNAFWDAHFLHLRNLIDFFSYNCSQLTDINVNKILTTKKSINNLKLMMLLKMIITNQLGLKPIIMVKKNK